MRLKQLTLHGFKSFADRTELRFHDGITAVVGPNGCGKSNISDAIRWVLGEQRASAIRSSKMDEAIFHGTAERRGLSRAEVGLVFSNDEGRLPVPYDELEIQRTVFREGGSDYQMNRASCRLRDILDVCRDTGLGANSYAVIEQGMVDAILSERADDRRQMFEEAAGIGRYKDRRRAAMRRLESAEADLDRLEDLISEVQSKVRSLARQRGRALRYQELRARRLSVEVTVALAELEEAHSRLEQTTGRLEALGREEPEARAALATAETELERVRVEAADAVRTRNETAAGLEQVARRIGERERELAVAEERRSHAERRLEQIARERKELQERLESLERELDGLSDQRTERTERLEELTEAVEAVRERREAARQEIVEARRAVAEAQAREDELARRVHRLEVAAEGAESRAAEAASRVDGLQEEEASLDAEFDRLGEQGDLFAQHAQELEERQAALAADCERRAERLEALRTREREARTALDQAQHEESRLSSRVAALDALERDYHGFAPAVAAALTHRKAIDGLVGPLTERLRIPAERAAAVESALGSLLQILLVRDAQAADRVRRHLAEESVDGTLAMLPDDAVPLVETLLERVELAGEPESEPVLVGRRERLERLRTEAAEAAEVRERRAAERERLAAEAAEAETALREAESNLRDVEIEIRRAEADESARSGRRSRAERMREELARQRTELETRIRTAKEDAESLRRERTELQAELERQRVVRQDAARDLDARESVGEEVGDEEAERRVEHARAESALAEVDRRVAAARQGLDQTRMRLRTLDREETEHRESLEQLGGVREDAGAGLETLFEERESLATELRTIEERVEEAERAAAALETQVRELRKATAERGEERHKLELARAQAEAAESRVRDRLEAEWGRPFEQLVREAEPAEGDPEMLRAELQGIAADLDRLGPINMLAIEEHEEESRRLEFLTEQRDDLVGAKEDLEKAIREINRKARELFFDTFERVRENFQSTFQTLFEGGECDLWLADPDDPLESDVEISASPRGKRTQRIHLLSGGERALTALALLFAIYRVKPSPFCVLDEVDAPLDDANIGRFVAMLERFKSETQFIIITHNPRTMEAADWIYGVTMEEPGVSRIVGVQLEDALVGAA